jgi:hypothetical protein
MQAVIAVLKYSTYSNQSVRAENTGLHRTGVSLSKVYFFSIGHLGIDNSYVFTRLIYYYVTVNCVSVCLSVCVWRGGEVTPIFSSYFF